MSEFADWLQSHGIQAQDWITTMDDGNEDAPKKSAEAPAPLQEEKELFDARIILVSTQVNARLAHAINTRLLAMERADEKRPIYLFINSPGGEVHSGFSIFDTARFVRPPIVTVVTGLAASMGSIIALAAPRERRFAFPNSKFLIHQPLIAGGLTGSATDIEIHANDLLATKDRIVDLYVSETKQSKEVVKKSIDRDNWMTPVQALEFGLISKIIEKRDDLKV